MDRIQYYRNESIIRIEYNFFKNHKVDTWDYFKEREKKSKKISEKDKEVFR
jgi:hypothetical protein